MINVYIADVSNLDINENIELVNEERKEKVLKYKAIDDQKLSLGAFLLLKKVLELQNLSIDLTFIYNSFGKPYFKNNNEYFFNISHSRTKVACVISDQEVGIDIQSIKEMTEKQMTLLQKKLLTKEELLKMNKPLQLKELYKQWVIKESYVKALGKGIFGNLEKIVLDDDQNIALLINEPPANYFSVELVDNYWLSIAYLKKDQINIEQLELTANKF